MQRQAIRLYAAYSQFYLEDERARCAAPVDWSEQDVERHMKTADNMVVVCPVVEESVPVEVEVQQTEPPYKAGDWDHIVECSLELPSGRLAVVEWPRRPVANFSVTPGCYRVRALFGNLRSVLRDEEPSDAFYKVVLWPAPFTELCVVKQVDWHRLLEEVGLAHIVDSRAERGAAADRGRHDSASRHDGSSGGPGG